jgi:hypothetical protein
MAVGDRAERGADLTLSLEVARERLRDTFVAGRDPTPWLHREI